MLLDEGGVKERRDRVWRKEVEEELGVLKKNRKDMAKEDKAVTYEAGIGMGGYTVYTWSNISDNV